MPSDELWNPRFDVTTDRNGTRVHFYPPFPGVHHYKMCIKDEEDWICIRKIYQIKKSQNETIVIPALDRNKRYRIMVRPYDSGGDYMDAWLFTDYSYTEVVSTSKSSKVPTTTTAQTKSTSIQTSIRSDFFKGIISSPKETETIKTHSTKSIPARGVTSEDISSYLPPMNPSITTPYLSYKTFTGHRSRPSSSQAIAGITTETLSPSSTIFNKLFQTPNSSNTTTTPYTTKKMSSIQPYTNERTLLNSAKFQQPYSTTPAQAHQVNQGKVYGWKNENMEWNTKYIFIGLSAVFVAIILIIMIYALVYRKRPRFWNWFCKASLREDSYCYKKEMDGTSYVTLINPYSRNENLDVNEEETKCYDVTVTIRTPLSTPHEMPPKEDLYLKNACTEKTFI